MEDPQRSSRLIALQLPAPVVEGSKGGYENRDVWYISISRTTVPPSSDSIAPPRSE